MGCPETSRDGICCAGERSTWCLASTALSKPGDASSLGFDGEDAGVVSSWKEKESRVSC